MRFLLSSLLLVGLLMGSCGDDDPGESEAEAEAEAEAEGEGEGEDCPAQQCGTNQICCPNCEPDCTPAYSCYTPPSGMSWCRDCKTPCE